MSEDYSRKTLYIPVPNPYAKAAKAPHTTIHLHDKVDEHQSSKICIDWKNTAASLTSNRRGTSCSRSFKTEIKWLICSAWMWALEGGLEIPRYTSILKGICANNIRICGLRFFRTTYEKRNIKMPAWDLKIPDTIQILGLVAKECNHVRVELL